MKNALTLTAVVFLIVLALVSAAWAKSNPEQKARDAYAHEIAIAAEHDGWNNIAISAAKSGALYGRLGNHDALRIEARQQGIFAAYVTLDWWDVQTTDRFIAQEITPRMKRLHELGFIQMDIMGLPRSLSYPGQATVKIY